MKKIFAVMLLTVCSIGLSATNEIKLPKVKAVKTKKVKTTDKNYEGEYLRATNTFIYTKDNLVFPNKITSYTVNDESGLLDGIYNFISEKYGVVDNDLIGLKVVGTINKKDKTITIKKITNYQVPEDKILGEESEYGIDENIENTDTNIDDTNINTESIFPTNPSNNSGFLLK